MKVRKVSDKERGSKGLKREWEEGIKGDKKSGRGGGIESSSERSRMREGEEDKRLLSGSSDERVGEVKRRFKCTRDKEGRYGDRGVEGGIKRSKGFIG